MNQSLLGLFIVFHKPNTQKRGHCCGTEIQYGVSEYEM
jgi:hypothetical protein